MHPELRALLERFTKEEVGRANPAGRASHDLNRGSRDLILQLPDLDKSVSVQV